RHPRPHRRRARRPRPRRPVPASRRALLRARASRRPVNERASRRRRRSHRARARALFSDARGEAARRRRLQARLRDRRQLREAARVRTEAWLRLSPDLGRHRRRRSRARPEARACHPEPRRRRRIPYPNRMNIGICGGTFDPFHRGHIDPILAACETMRWDRILYVPTYKQPFKTHLDAASEYHRFVMTVLATLERDEMFVLTLELERGAISYTVDTLEVLRARHPDDTLDWIIGDDNLAQLLDWKSLDRIFELANFC